MANYDLQYQDTYIDTLLATVNELKSNGYIFKGVATPTTNPGTTTEKCAYIASEAGTYANFGNLSVPAGLHVLVYNGSVWSIQTLLGNFGIEQTTGQSTTSVMSQKAVTDELDKLFGLTHFNDFTTATLWANKSYEGLGLYSMTGYYSFGLFGVSAGSKVLLYCDENATITKSRSYINDDYIKKQMSSGDTTLIDITPTIISNTLRLYAIPSGRTNIGFTFNGKPSFVKYYVINANYNIIDYLNENFDVLKGVEDDISIPLSEDVAISLVNTSLTINTNTGYWAAGSQNAYGRFQKVSPNTEYIIYPPTGYRTQVIQLKNTSATSGAYPDYAGNTYNNYSGAINEVFKIKTAGDCEYIYFFYHNSLNFRVPQAIKKITKSSETFKNFIAENESHNITELAPISDFGCYINTGTWKWATATTNAYAVIYKVVGNTKLIVSAGSAACQFNWLKSINASNGSSVSFASDCEYTNINLAAESTQEYNVPFDAEYVYFLALPLNGTPYLPPISVKGIVAKCISCIDFIGDSLTQGGYSTTNPRGYYAGKVMQYLNIDGYNMGAGGENAATILGRCDGIPYKLASNVTIPADTSQVQITLTNIYGQYLLPILQRYTSHDVVIDGIEGVLTTTQTNPAATTANYFFARKTAGTSTYSAKQGDNIFVKDFKSTLNPYRAKIIWIGQNGGYDTNSTDRYGGDVTSATDRARLIDMIKTYISACGCEYYMVLSPSQRTNAELEADFAKAFGSRYFNVRMYMVNHGIADAITLGFLSSSTYPTAQDQTDMANGVVPTSLRADNVHFTESGYYTLAYGLSVALKEVWNL